MFLKRCLNFPIIALCTELSVLLGNIKMHFDITLVAEKLKCMIVLITTLKDPPPLRQNIEKKNKSERQQHTYISI